MKVRSAATGLYATCTFASVTLTPERLPKYIEPDPSLVDPRISVFTLVNAATAQLVGLGSWNSPVSLYEVGVIDRSSKKNREPRSVPSGRLLVYSFPVSSSSTSRMLSIITTKRKRIAIAPTYTII